MNGITVRGRGSASRAPDMATMVLSVEAQAAQAGDAQASASRRMSAVLEALRDAGIADVDIATTQVSLGPSFDYSGNTPRLIGFTASQGITVRVRALGDLGPLIDRAIAAGASGVSEVSLGLSEPAAALDEAREAAVADALRQAQALASAAGVGLGAPIAITIADREPGPRPLMRMKAEMAMDASATPIAVGTSEVIVEVDVTFAILGA
jgi:uncharacterized protein YggE